VYVVVLLAGAIVLVRVGTPARRLVERWAGAAFAREGTP
jgi:uncharacterized membrane protein